MDRGSKVGALSHRWVTLTKLIELYGSYTTKPEVMILVKGQSRERKGLLIGAGRETESEGRGTPESVIDMVETVQELTSHNKRNKVDKRQPQELD